MVGLPETKCDNITHMFNFLKCIVDLAIEERNPSLCMKLNVSSANTCYQSYSVHRLSRETCNDLLSSNITGGCFKIVDWAIENNVCLGGGVAVAKDVCFVELSQVKKDSAYCGNISDMNLRLLCEAVVGNKPQLCGEIADGAKRGKCVSSIGKEIEVRYSNEAGEWW
jgi:hypothetical protein